MNICTAFALLESLFLVVLGSKLRRYLADKAMQEQRDINSKKCYTVKQICKLKTELEKMDRGGPKCRGCPEFKKEELVEEIERERQFLKELNYIGDVQAERASKLKK
eukprot:jgi/Antlo1/836/1928